MYDMMQDYQYYNPGFRQRQSPAPPAMGGAAGALPWVQAGLSGAALLSNLYGAYQAGEIAEDNFEEQRRQFEIQRDMEAERIRRQREQEDLANTYAAAQRADQGEDRLLNRYAGYYRQIGL